MNLILSLEPVQGIKQLPVVTFNEILYDIRNFKKMHMKQLYWEPTSALSVKIIYRPENLVRLSLLAIHLIHYVFSPD